jgi:hypothetical protein
MFKPAAIFGGYEVMRNLTAMMMMMKMARRGGRFYILCKP